MAGRLVGHVGCYVQDPEIATDMAAPTPSPMGFSERAPRALHHWTRRAMLR